MARRKVDVHAHFIPDVYRQALLDLSITHPEGMPGIPDWSAESHLTYMNVSRFTLASAIRVPLPRLFMVLCFILPRFELPNPCFPIWEYHQPPSIQP